MTPPTPSIAWISSFRSVPVTYFDVYGDEEFFKKFNTVFDPLNNQEHFFDKAPNGKDCIRYTQVSNKFPTIDFALYIAFLVARDYNNVLEARHDFYGFIEKLKKLYNDVEIHSSNTEREKRINRILYSLYAAAIPD